MASSYPASFLLVLGSYLSVGGANNICNEDNWDSGALHNYCTFAGLATYRSPACTMYRLCDSSSGVSPSLEPALCRLDRLFLTLCADQPELTECSTFRRRLITNTGHDDCLRAVPFKLWSTEAVRHSLAVLCSSATGSGSARTSAGTAAACELCNADHCDTADVLLAYAAVCLEAPTAVGCESWVEFCAQETPAAAPALCLPPSAGGRGGRRADGALRITTTNGQPYPPLPPADPCILNPTEPSCKSYKYPDSAARANIDTLCLSMPDMPGCAIDRACASGQHRVADNYCRPFVVLATLCHDMPGMRGCENYRRLCKEDSVVEQCAVEGPVPRAPTTSQARKAVLRACDDHPMAGCASCTSMECPDPLASLAAICHEMPDMSACSGFWAFCDAAGMEDVAEWCGEDDSKYLPSMLMYFHQRTQELLLWKEWRPRTQGQYLVSVLAIVAMGVVATGLKTAKGALALQWNHQRALSGEELRVVSVWMPRNGQLTEILAKSAFTGVSLTLDYFNMLIAMTFNVGFFCAVIAGYIIGTLLFSHVLENYAALLHQRRHDAAARMKLRQLSPGRPLNGNSGGMDLLANGNGFAREGAAANAVYGNRVVAVANRVSSDEDEAEEKLLMVIEGEGECNCVHSA